MLGKIVLEEHFALPETLGQSEQYAPNGSWAQLGHRLLDLDGPRLREMDLHGIERAILSLNSPGVQELASLDQAVDLARRANDALAQLVKKRPDRFGGFAALPMQDPTEAIVELKRSVETLGLCGALVNGFSDISGGRVAYYDAPEYLPFWEEVERLNVPFYLHPRDPLTEREPIYSGHPWFRGSAWAFGVETSAHALRLMGCGLFDQYPRLTIILGHLGEGLPYNIWRLDHRLSKSPRGIPAKKTMTEYLQSNFYLTTSGNFRTSTLVNAIAEMGVERILFSVDYPFEDVAEAVEWFDAVRLAEIDHRQIGRTNALRLFGLATTRA